MSGSELAAPAQRELIGERSDAELVKGSTAEFGVLFDRYATQLYRYCVHRVGPHLAEDVVAETFLIAYERRQRYDPAYPRAGAWLYGIATNVVHRRRGAEARAHRAVASLAGTGSATWSCTEPDPAERAAERVDAQALVRAVADALAGLSRRHRDVLLLLAAGLEQDEIATALGLSPGTVRSRLHRARTRLREAMDNQRPTRRADPSDQRGEQR